MANQLELNRDIANDEHWQDYTHEFLIRADTTYLNHGSFGPPPNEVRLARRKYIDALNCQPMDFFVRQFECELLQARESLAEFVGTRAANLVFAENATFGMNVVADSFPLQPGDEVLLNNHEYGAVVRIWNRRCARAGASVRVVDLPQQFESRQQIVDSLVEAASAKTKLAVFSHITSATALILPAKELSAAFREKGIATCIDGPHAPVQIELDVDSLGCDFYTASCHKWLCATFGTGFLYVHPAKHDLIEPQLKSWGRLLPELPQTWDEEFTWSGTRDPSPYLSVPAAIRFFTERVGLDAFRNRSRFLASTAEAMLVEEFQTRPIGKRDDGWYGSMAHVPLPEGDHSTLQTRLWKEYGIEIPVIHFESRWFIRVSCHLYNTVKQLETLLLALRKLLL